VELPEVEVMRRDLEKDVVGRRIGKVDVRPQKNALTIIKKHHRTRKEFASLLQGRKITGIERRGKYLLVKLDDDSVLVVHFKMSGRFVRGRKGSELQPHTHVHIEFAQGGDLRFVDPRAFGRMFVAPADKLETMAELQKIGIDPLEHTFTWPEFSAKLAERRMKLKPLLMDQEFIAGLGNIYSDEVLFAAGLRHDRKSDELSSQEVRRLYRAIQEVVQDAIRFRGTTLEDQAYVDLFGNPGENLRELKVYGRRGQACRRCRSPIEMVKISGRGSYFCPVCQT